MASIFSRIVAGEIPCYKVAETDRFLAFLDVRPRVRGHVLCIPKVEIDYIFGLEDQLLADLMVFAKHIALAVERVVPCTRVGVMVIGLEVPHAHIHLMPMRAEKDMFSTNTVIMSVEEMQALADQISNQVEN
jgi:histidine triad (HIT) family protein